MQTVTFPEKDARAAPAFKPRRRISSRLPPAHAGCSVIESARLWADRSRQKPAGQPTMKRHLLLALATASALAVGSLFAADSAKEQTLTGKAMCAKCELNEADKCTNALQVAGKDGKTTTYLLADNKVSKDFHGKVCKGTLDGVAVTGSVKEMDGKQVITASKIAAK
jgi:hypothetical protein